MTMMKNRLTATAIYAFGILAAVCAWVDLRKAWISLTIMTLTLGIGAVLDRLHDSQGGKVTK